MTTFGTARIVGRQSNAPATFTPGEIPGTHFQRTSRPQGAWFCQTIQLVAQRLNHYATPGPQLDM